MMTHATLSPLLVAVLPSFQGIGHYLSSAESLALVIIGFGFLIFVHELGHFLVAKWAGVRCPQFAIGFGTPIVAYRRGMGFRLGGTEPEYEKRARQSLQEQGIDTDDISERRIYEAADKLGLGETEYRLNWVPLGGYVKMVGQEDMDPTAASDDPRSFTHQAIWKRACILSAGVTMNMIFGMIFLIVAFMAGVKFPTPVIGGVRPDSPAASTYAQGHLGDPSYKGIQVGDRIVTVNGSKVRDFQDIAIATALDRRKTSLRYGIQRPGVDHILYYDITPKPDKSRGMLTIGIAPTFGLNVKTLVEGSDAYLQGLHPGTKLAKVNGKPVTTYAQFYHSVINAEGKPVSATFVPDPKATTDQRNSDKKHKITGPIQVKLTAMPLLVSSGDQLPNLLGLVPAITVKYAKKGDPAANAGIKAGDIIAQINHIPWPSGTQILDAIQNSSHHGVGIAVLRNGKRVNIANVKPNSKDKIGIFMGHPNARVAQVLPDSPAASLDLPDGSTILAINGRKVHNWADMQRVLGHLKSTEGEPTKVTLTYLLNIAGQPTETGTLILAPEQVKQLASAEWVPPLGIAFGELREKVGAGNPLSAAILGLKKTKQFMVQTYISLLRLLEGSVSVKQLRGPVGIVQIGTTATQYGWEYLFFFLGIISINLAVLNFLPLPIVDGGHIVFLIIEKIKGSPVSAQIQVATMVVGLALIGGVMLLATYNDIARLITG